jgi:SAM-dependent methyltransferase
MSEIEQRTEGNPRRGDYAARVFTVDEVAKGTYRAFQGGMWDTAGRLNLDFLKAAGLRPEHKFLDVGCGEFHSSKELIDYLNPGNYYGIDENASLLRAGYEVELNDEQRSRLPLENLRVTDRYDADFGVHFDFALASALFTHLSLNDIRLCLYRISKVMKAGGKFYASYNEQWASQLLDTIVRRHNQLPYQTERNAYWYYREDLVWAARFSPWSYRHIGDWGHRSEQRLAEFTRTRDEQIEDLSPAQQRIARLYAFVARVRRWAARRVDPT